MTASRSIIVVGAGHIGLACAHYLRRDGHEVTVVDQGAVGGACSQANCGFLVPDHVLPLTTPDAPLRALLSLFRPRAAFRVKPQLRPDLLRWLSEFGRRCTRRKMLDAARVLHPLLEASIEEYGTLLSDPQIDSGWQQAGMLFVFESDEALGGFADTDAMLTREFGVTARFIGGNDLAGFEPALRDGLAGAYFYDIDGHLQPDRLNASWAALSRDRGVEFIEQCRVASIDKSAGRIAGLNTSHGRMTADCYVFATGAWSRRWSEELGCRIPVEPGKGYSVTMARPATMPGHPMLMPEKHIGVTPFDDSLRIASMMEFAGFDKSIPDFRIRQLQESAQPYLRESAGPAIRQTWYGWRPMTWDSLPIIGRVPDRDNALVATGHNMLGLTLAPITGRIIADLVAGRSSALPVEALSPARFG
ncbi:MAG: FAD-dependent oxidoreductase [Woeseiaceae bacterium]